MGLDIGSLVFMRLSDWGRVYCRLSVVNRHIGHVFEIGEYLVCCSGAGGSNTHHLASQVLNLLSFAKNSQHFKLHHVVNLARPVQQIKVIQCDST